MPVLLNLPRHAATLSHRTLRSTMPPVVSSLRVCVSLPIAVRESKEWGRIAPQKSRNGIDRIEPRYSDAYRKKLDLAPGFHPSISLFPTSANSSSLSTPSLSTTSSTASTKSSLFLSEDILAAAFYVFFQTNAHRLNEGRRTRARRGSSSGAVCRRTVSLGASARAARREGEGHGDWL